jgi:hypothetical protein
LRGAEIFCESFRSIAERFFAALARSVDRYVLPAMIKRLSGALAVAASTTLVAFN